jgi:hypothetical protein
MQTFSSMSEMFDHAERQGQLTTIMGMVKAHDGDGRYFMYSPFMCDHWVQIPADGVEEVEYLGRAPCRKPGEEPHSHPLVKVRLKKECVDELPYLAVIADLVKQRQAAMRWALGARRGMTMRRVVTTPSARPVGEYYANERGSWQDLRMPCFPVTVEGEGVYVCCCDDNGDNCECTGVA